MHSPLGLRSGADRGRRERSCGSNAAPGKTRTAPVPTGAPTGGASRRAVAQGEKIAGAPNSGRARRVWEEGGVLLTGQPFDGEAIGEGAFVPHAEVCAPQVVA